MSVRQEFLLALKLKSGRCIIFSLVTLWNTVEAILFTLECRRAFRSHDFFSSNKIGVDGNTGGDRSGVVLPRVCMGIIVVMTAVTDKR